MKQHLTLLLLFAILASCKSPSNKNFHPNTVVNNDSISINIDTPNLTVPVGFKLDTIRKFDISINTDIFLQYPVYINDSTGFNKQLKAAIFQKLNDFLKLITKGYRNHPNNFEVNTTAINAYSQKINYCFIITSYQSPAAHPSAVYFSFNYDLTKNKQLFFSDYFNLPESNDTAAFKKILNLSMERPADFGIRYLANTCFNPGTDSIEFLIDDFYQAVLANEAVKVKIPKKDLEHFIKKSYH